MSPFEEGERRQKDFVEFVGPFFPSARKIVRSGFTAINDAVISVFAVAYLPKMPSEEELERYRRAVAGEIEKARPLPKAVLELLRELGEEIREERDDLIYIEGRENRIGSCWLTIKVESC